MQWHNQWPNFKLLVFCAALGPLCHEVWNVSQGLEIDPVAAMLHASGYWALVFLLLTLSITPLRRVGFAAKIISLRRMLGLYAFFYATLHFALYLGLEQQFDPAAITHDIASRPFIAIGFAALLLMVPLALTSTNGWMRRLKRRWGQLHRLTYLVSILGVIHYWWQVKRDLQQPLLFGTILLLLLLLRLLPGKKPVR
jgi:sulfoxide reductase heme-binding subunit YedZ